MPRRRTKSRQSATPPQRSVLVVGSFIGAMTLVGGMLLLTDSTPAPRLGTGWDGIGTPAVSAGSLGRTILDTAVPIKSDRWTEIRVYDSGSPYGSAESISRQHQAAHLKGIGYHFVIGNGNGMGDGELHVGYRWNEQLAGAHFAGPDESTVNNRSLGICLVGNGERNGFTQRQVDRLVELVRGLQARGVLTQDGIESGRVIIADSMGSKFPADIFRAQLLTP